MNRILIILAVLALIIPAGLLAQDIDNPEAGLEDCKLTEEQREQMHDIRVDNQKQMIDLHADLEKLEMDKREALRDDDYAKARKVTKSIFAKQQEIALLRIDMMEDISQILTDEQKEAWRSRRMMVRGPEGRNNRHRFPQGMRGDHCDGHPNMQRHTMMNGPHSEKPMMGPCGDGDYTGDCDGPEQQQHRHQQQKTNE